MSDKEAQIAKIKAELAADAAKAKSRQKAAADKAASKPARTDAEIMKGAKKQGVDTRAEAPKNKGKLAQVAKAGKTVDPNADTQVLKAKKSGSKPVSADTVAAKPARQWSGNLDIPQGDTKVFDFEKAPAAKSELNLVKNDAITETTASGAKTQTYEPRKQKGKLAKAAKAAKTPELPGVKATAAPELPDRPLAGQGSMEGKPVEKVTVKVSDKLLTKEGVAKWNAAQDADRRISQGSAPQAERRAATAAKVRAGDADLAAVKRSVKPSSSVRFGGRIAAAGARAAATPKTATPVAESLASKAGSLAAKGAKWAGSNTGKALISTAKSVTSPVWEPFAKFAAGHGERKAAHVAADAAVTSAKGLKANVAARAAKGWAAARTGGAVALTGGRLAVGGVKMAGEGIAAATLWEIGKGAAMAETSSRAAMNQHVRSGEKQGLKVSHAEPSFARMAFGGSPKIKVHDPSQDTGPDGKSLSQKRREQGEYVRLKKAAGRNIITGSYRPKGGSENV